MASFKFFLFACMVAACVAAETATPTTNAGKTGEVNTETKRDKKDVLLSTVTYPAVQPAVSLLKTGAPIATPIAAPIATVGAVSPISYYRTALPYSYYPYSYYPYSYYPYSYYPTNAYYLRK